MKGKSIVSWFTTSNGRKFTFGGVCCVGIGMSAACFLSHTFLLEKYKEIVQMYGLGIGVPVPAKVKKCMEEVMDDMHISERERKFIKPFTVFGFDMFHAGCTQTLQGAIIGIPSNFSYETTADVDRSHILVNMDQVSWNSEAGQNLLNAMILSEDAQKFAIGREIAHVRTHYVYYQSLFPALVVTGVYGFTSTVNEKMGLLTRPLPLRLILYSLTGMFGFGSWCLMQDFTTVRYETKSDTEMCSLGEKYIKGGIEFYSKLLERNIALRKLMGEKGEKLYSVKGNEQYMLRQRHTPLTYRKEYLEQQLQLQKKEQEATKVKNEQKIVHDTSLKVPAPA